MTAPPKLSAYLRVTGIRTDIAADSDQAFTLLIEHVLQTNDDTLEVSLATLANVVADLSQVDVVKCGINLVHDKERGRMVGMDCKQKCQGGDSLFSTTKLLHVAEALHRRHRVELETTFVRLLCVIEAEIGLASERMFATLGHISVDSLESTINVVEGLVEAFSSHCLDSLECLHCLLCLVLRFVIVRVTVLETLRDGRECIGRLKIITQQRLSKLHESRKRTKGGV